MKNVLITGGAGFIGSHLADNLYKSGKYNIRILDNLSEKTHYGRWPKYLNHNYELFLGDVSNRIDLKSALKDVNIIFHLAAELDLNPQYQRFIDTNVGSTALIFELINEFNYPVEKVIIASTQFVYGHGKWGSSKGDVFYPEKRVINDFWDFSDGDEKLNYLICKEDQKVNPPNHYALSKYFQEKFSITMGKLNNIHVNILRFSIIHGPRQSIKNTYSGALRTFCYFSALNKSYSSFEDNLSLRDFTPVYDAVEACKVVLEKGLPYEYYNITNSEAISVKKLGEIISKFFNSKAIFSTKTEWRHGDIRHAVSCNKKLLKLGFEPKYTIEQVIKEYVEWFKKQNLDFDRFLKTQKEMRKNGQIRSK